MNDYGFATYDERSGKRIEGTVNSKWPIFGPNYADIKRAFRTIHITDTKQYSYRTSSSVSLPSAVRNGISQYHGYEKILVATIPHGYKKRPLGYVTISGSFVKNTRGKWAYTRTTDYYGWYPPSATLYGVGTTTGNMQSSVGGGLRPLTDTGDFSVFGMNPFSNCNISYPADSYWYMVDNYYTIPGNNSSQEDGFGEERPPYGVEIDDNNVYLYRYYYWSDVYKRDYYNNGSNTVWDLRARMQGIIDYAGSDFDVTIYLCPYSMEDLV